MTETAVENLPHGALVDLEGDPFAEMNASDVDTHVLKYEYAVVDYVDRETDETVVVYFDNYAAVGFPVGHLVLVEEDR
jgi:hypothetical protein